MPRASIAPRSVRAVRVLACLPLLAGLLLASGCFWSYGRFDPLDRGDGFDEARKHFTRSIRWGQFEAAARWVPADERPAFMELSKHFESYRFTYYEVELVDLDPEFKNGTVDVRYRAYSLASMIEQEVRMSQNWERDEESGDWIVRPVFHQGGPSAP